MTQAVSLKQSGIFKCYKDLHFSRSPLCKVSLRKIRVPEEFSEMCHQLLRSSVAVSFERCCGTRRELYFRSVKGRRTMPGVNLTSYAIPRCGVGV